jgi:hypothetical protein
VTHGLRKFQLLGFPFDMDGAPRAVLERAQQVGHVELTVASESTKD